MALPIWRSQPRAQPANPREAWARLDFAAAGNDISRRPQGPCHPIYPKQAGRPWPADSVIPMFETLSGRLGSVFDRLTRRGALSPADVEAALRDIRVALLEADVALPVVKDFIASIRERAVGQEVLKSVTPGQMVVKVVNDRLVELLGGEAQDLALAGAPPRIVLMVGLQGSGKTTTSAKLGLRLRTRERQKVLLASLDVQRPAAQEQLAVLARQAGVDSLPVVPGEAPLAIAARALESGQRQGYDVVILDTAGRLHIDDALMAELEASARPGAAARDPPGRRCA